MRLPRTPSNIDDILSPMDYSCNDGGACMPNYRHATRSANEVDYGHDCAGTLEKSQ
jgi:hypothetical protein